MLRYANLVKQQLGSFVARKLEHIPRDSNEKMNALAPYLCLKACWHFQKTRLVAVSLLALSKDQTCGSKLVGTFKRPDL